MHVLVLTVVHTPLDARIYRRQIRSMVEAGWQVTYAAPWTARGVTPPDDVTPVDLPRSTGRERVAALRAARRVLRRHVDVDLVLLHDPELLLALAGLDDLPPVVWDVHEDTASALTDKDWLPSALRPLARPIVQAGERWAEDRAHLLLAEERYRERFLRDHAVIPNYPPVPADVRSDGEDRVVYVGRLSRGRGVEELIEVGRLLAPEITLELVGWGDDVEVGDRLRRADENGHVRWGGGFVPNDEALGRVDGSLAGLSLLRDEPNYRHSLPTKVLEYLSRRVPVITTPLPAAEEIVERYHCGLVVPFEDPVAAADAVRGLRNDLARRDGMAGRGYDAVRERYSWGSVEQRFLDQLTTWASRP